MKITNMVTQQKREKNWHNSCGGILGWVHSILCENLYCARAQHEHTANNAAQRYADASDRNNPTAGKIFLSLKIIRETLHLIIQIWCIASENHDVIIRQWFCCVYAKARSCFPPPKASEAGNETYSVQQERNFIQFSYDRALLTEANVDFIVLPGLLSILFRQTSSANNRAVQRVSFVI